MTHWEWTNIRWITNTKSRFRCKLNSCETYIRTTTNTRSRNQIDALYKYSANNKHEISIRAKAGRRWTNIRSIKNTSGVQDELRKRNESKYTAMRIAVAYNRITQRIANDRHRWNLSTTDMIGYSMINNRRKILRANVKTARKTMRTYICAGKGAPHTDS